MGNQQAYSHEFDLNAENNPVPASMGRPEAAAYVGKLCGELAGISRRHGLDTMAYLLDMAALEAANEAEHLPDPTLSVK